LFRAVACAAVLWACSVAVPGQSPNTKKAGPPTGPISSARREGIFRIDVVVTDAADAMVTDLAPRDFKLLDNGQPTRIFTLQPPENSEVEPDSPKLILVFDSVSLLPQELASAEHAAAEFLRENQGRLPLPTYFYRITRDGLFSSPDTTTDGNALAGEIEKRKGLRTVWRPGMRNPAARTTLDDEGMKNSITLRALGTIAIDQKRLAGRKILVWFGHGAPVIADMSCGFNEIAELSTHLRAARITVELASLLGNPGIDDYVAAGETGSVTQPPKLSPPVIAAQTGGGVLNRSHDLKRELERWAAEARGSYSLTFDPPHTEHSNEYHSLAVAVSRPGLASRTVTGYYNQPVYFDHPRPNVERVTVAQLEDTIRRQGGSAGFLQHLGNMELTERLTNDKHTQLAALLHRDREREALAAIADLSEFLSPPGGEALPDTAPGRDAEMGILRKTFDYLANSLPKLPDFFATRSTISFQEPQVRDEDSCWLPSNEEPLRVAYTGRGTVLYRNGVEVVDAETSHAKRLAKPGSQGRERALDTKGTFGPVLTSVLVAAANGQSTLTWSRWEQSGAGNLAVFHFVVPSTTPMFEVTYCCLPKGDGSTVYRNMTGYHGEFAVDPETGAINRLAIEADLGADRDPRAPLIRSALMVEYGPIEIGGRLYILPVRSVSISRGRTLRELHEWGMDFIVYGPFETLLNDFSFTDYHKFGSESRMLTGFEEVPDPQAPPRQSAAPPSKPQ
jgi:VWFA-related protein